MFCYWWLAPSWRRASEPSPRHCVFSGGSRRPISQSIMVCSTRLYGRPAPSQAGCCVCWSTLSTRADAAVVIGIDDTIERRWGRKSGARGIYPRSGPFFEGTLRQDQRPALVVLVLVHIPWVGRIMGLPFLTVLTVQGLPMQDKPRSPKTLLDWARQVALQIHRWLPGRRIVIVGDHCVRRGRFPRCRPKLCVSVVTRLQPRRQSLCPRTTQTTGPRTTGGQGQAPAHTDASAARCRHGLATPHRHALVWPHQSCR